MGGRATSQLSPEDELGELISGAQVRDQSSPEEELSGLLASSGPPRAPAASAPSQGGVFVEPPPQDDRSWVARAQDTDNARNGGISPIERMSEAAVGAGGQVYEGLGAAAKYAASIGHGALQGGLTHYRDDPDHDLLGALIAARNSGVASGALGATGATIGGAGSLVQKGADKARAGAFNASKSDLQAMGVTPREFAQRTDDLGLNNPFKPMDVVDKRARIQDVLADRGAQHAEAIASADAQNPLAGRNVNNEIASDIDQNADRVWTGRSNQREGIVNAMGKTANAVAQGDPIDSLAELGRYRTQQGGQAFGKFGTLPEAASGRGALAGYDSADQHLTEAMRDSGDANFQKFTNADNDFHDAKMLEELTNQAPPANPYRRAIGAGVGAAAGFAAGGHFGAPVGAMVADLTRGYHADAAANLLSPIAGFTSGVGGAMQASAPGMAPAAAAAAKWLGSKGVQTGQQAPASEQEQHAAIGESTATGHGNRLGAAAAQMFRQNPQALGEWATDFEKADQEGSGAMSALVGRLMIDDPAFRSGPGLQLQQMTR